LKLHFDSDQAVVIGDIHGCAKTLERLWEKLQPYEDRMHIFVGDYIDRGEDSKGVIDFLLSVRDQRSCVFLKGNHEEMLLRATEPDRFELWLRNGGKATMRSYGYPATVEDLPSTHRTFFEETVLCCDLPSFFVVHAGIPHNVTIDTVMQTDEYNDYMLWDREHLNVFETAWEKTVIFGHTARAYPIRKEKMLGIDTGCVYDAPGFGKLTAVVLPEMTFVQQFSLDQTYALKGSQ